MTEQDISPLRRRVIEDMTCRRTLNIQSSNNRRPRCGRGAQGTKKSLSLPRPH
jgi:hypothetical protein